MEMQLGRSREFLHYLLPHIKILMGDQPALQADNFVRLTQQVKPGYIRVDADELSYPAHIVLRYEIERALIEGEIEVDDIPALWDEKMQQSLGIDTRGNYRDGCMQDIHWTDGAFGYFPTYTLGAMYAAQLFQAVKKAIPQMSECIKDGELQPVFDWLQQNIWQHGSRFSTGQLLLNATGEALNPACFRQHLEQRYLNRYVFGGSGAAISPASYNPLHADTKHPRKPFLALHIVLSPAPQWATHEKIVRGICNEKIICAGDRRCYGSVLCCFRG